MRRRRERHRAHRHVLPTGLDSREVRQAPPDAAAPVRRDVIKNSVDMTTWKSLETLIQSAGAQRSPPNMPRRGSPSPRDYYRDYNRSGSRTPRRGPGSVASYSSYDSEDEEGPTLFGSILRTIMAGSAVVAIAILVRPPAPRAPPIASMARPGASAAFASAFARLDPRARVPPGPPPRPFISFPPSAFAPADETRRPKLRADSPNPSRLDRPVRAG